jgi:hypothetical protein
MTPIARALEQAAVVFDQHVETCIADYEIILRDHGATDDELAAELERLRADCLEERARVLGQVRAWLERGATTLQ